MEVVYYAARANLRRLLRLYPHWTHQQYAQAVGMSLGWVKKWKKRLQVAAPEDEQVLHSRSRARKHPPERRSRAGGRAHHRDARSAAGGLAAYTRPQSHPVLSAPRRATARPTAAALEPDDLPHLATSWPHRPATSTAARAARAACTNESLATGFQGCQYGARRARWQAAARGGSPERWSMRAPRYSSRPKRVLNFTRRPPWGRWPSWSCATDGPRRCAWTAMCALSAVPRAATSLRRWCGFVSAWEWVCCSVTHGRPSRTALSSAIIAAIKQNV
jgi:hypothetical protein